MKRPLQLCAVLGLIGLSYFVWSNDAFASVEAPQESEEDEDEDAPSELETDPLTFDDWPMSKTAKRGRLVYQQYCIGCHGESGEGDGEASAMMNPIPRNLQRGKIKFRSTPYNKPPRPEDLYRTITCGLTGSSMPSFKLVPEPKRLDVVDYVMYLISFGMAKEEVKYLVGEEEMKMADLRKDKLPEMRERIWKEIREVPTLPVPPEPPVTPESIALGRKQYQLRCSLCHGAKGQGDGASSYTMRDWKDSEILPRDFTGGVFRAGGTGRDIYMRLQSGLSGTPMGTTSGSASELWALVHFLQTLIKPKPAPQTGMVGPGCATHEERGR